ncbi:hypothetical protein [Hyphomicrobium sp.]|uniref:VHL beta domain-containing protein n=1 Tax=Hyphomicrobium sp. TaxID=82 RepID=UPI003F7196CB
MTLFAKTSPLRVLLAGAGLVLLPQVPGDRALTFFAPTSAQAEEAAAPDAAEKDAFQAAKDLGTADAWNAFLANYPKGFHADLARAYLKKVDAPKPASPAAAVNSARELSCSDAAKLRSQEAKQAAKIRFVNESEATLVIQWVGYQGGLEEYGVLQPGADMVLDTFLTHPWITAYEEGSCRQAFLPTAGESVARLLPEAQLPHGSSQTKSDEPAPQRQTVKPSKPSKPSQATVERRAKASCVEMGMAYINGKCAPKTKAGRDQAAKNKTKACPAGMYRNPNGQCQPNETGG